MDTTSRRGRGRGSGRGRGRGRILGLGPSPLLRGIGRLAGTIPGVPAPPVISLRKQRSDEGKRIFAEALDDDDEEGGKDSDTEAQHEVARAPARATTPEPKTQLETCAICWDHLEAAGGDAAPLELCGHTFHAHCLVSHIRTETQSLRIPVRCPSCPAHRAGNASLLTDLDFSRLVSAEERAALERGSVLRFVRDHGHLGRETKVRGCCRSVEGFILVPGGRVRSFQGLISPVLNLTFPGSDLAWSPHARSRAPFAHTFRSLFAHSLCSFLPLFTPLAHSSSLTPIAHSSRSFPSHTPPFAPFLHTLLSSPTPNPHSAALPHARLRMAGHCRGRFSRAQDRLVARSGGGQRPAPAPVPSLRRRCLSGVRRTRAPPRGPHVCGGGRGCQANWRDQRGGV